MLLESRRHIVRYDRHRVAGTHAALGERRGEPAAALERLFPGVAAFAMDDRDAMRIDGGRAQQKAGRRQRHEIRRVLVEAGLVRVRIVLGHRDDAWRPRMIAPASSTRSRTIWAAGFLSWISVQDSPA